MKEALGRLGNGGPVHRGFLTPVSIIGEVDMDLVSSKATGTFIGMTATRPQRDDRIETMPELVLLDACVCVCVHACMCTHRRAKKQHAVSIMLNTISLNSNGAMCVCIYS